MESTKYYLGLDVGDTIRVSLTGAPIEEIKAPTNTQLTPTA